MVIDRHKEIINDLTNEAISLMSDWPSAREKQKQFVLAYVSGGFKNATQAAKEAGFSEKSASKTAHNMLAGMEKYVHIPPVIKKLKKSFDRRSTELSIASAIEIKQFHTAVMRGELKEAL